MGHTVTKKVRLDEAYAARLARLAGARDETESEIIRRGIDLVDQMERREAAIDGLIAMAKRFPGPDEKVRYRFK